MADLPPDSVDVVRYATLPNASTYRSIMRVLVDNRTHGVRLRLTPGEIDAELQARFALALSTSELTRHLRELEEMGAVDPLRNFEKVRTAAELQHNNFSWDVTPQGKAVEEFFAQLATLEENVGSLESTRIPHVRELLGQLDRMTRTGDLDGGRLKSALGALTQELDALRHGAEDFMRDLGRVMHTPQAVEEDAFLSYKEQLLGYLRGFWETLGVNRDAMTEIVSAIKDDPARRTLMLETMAAVDAPGVLGKSADEVVAARVPQFEREWAMVEAWFAAEHSPLAALDSHVSVAIDWVLRMARLLSDRGRQRVDRHAEFRALARLFDRLDDDDAHAAWAAAFGLFGARHLGVPEADPDRFGAAHSWWAADPAPVLGYLRKPGRTPAPVGRVKPLADTSHARQLAAEAARASARTSAQLVELAGSAPVRLSELAVLPQAVFDVLVSCVGEALMLGVADGTGRARAQSSDGTLLLELLDDGAGRPPARLTGESGVLQMPDAQVAIVWTNRSPDVPAALSAAAGERR